MNQILHLTDLFYQLDANEKHRLLLPVITNPELIFKYMTIYYMHYLEKQHEVHCHVPQMIACLSEYIRQKTAQQQQQQCDNQKELQKTKATMNSLPKELTQYIGEYLNECNYINYAKINKRQYIALTTDGYKFAHLDSSYLVKIDRIYTYKRACESISSLTMHSDDLIAWYRFHRYNVPLKYNNTIFTNVSKLTINNDCKSNANIWGENARNYRFQLLQHLCQSPPNCVPVEELELVNFGAASDIFHISLLPVEYLVNILERFAQVRIFKMNNIYLDTLAVDSVETHAAIKNWKHLHTLHTSFNDSPDSAYITNTMAVIEQIRNMHSNNIINFTTNALLQPRWGKQIFNKLHTLEIFKYFKLEGFEAANLQTIRLTQIDLECYSVKLFAHIFQLKLIEKVYLEICSRSEWNEIAKFIVSALKYLSSKKKHFTLIIGTYFRSMKEREAKLKFALLGINEILQKLLETQIEKIRLVFIDINQYEFPPTEEEEEMGHTSQTYMNLYTMYKCEGNSFTTYEFITNRTNSILPGWNTNSNYGDRD